MSPRQPISAAATNCASWSNPATARRMPGWTPPSSARCEADPMTDDRSPETASSPWRQPIIWLVIALVAASVTGGVIMVTVASRDGPVGAVADQGQRTRQEQQYGRGPAERAGELGMSRVGRGG